jgi:hypothetical protein
MNQIVPIVSERSAAVARVERNAFVSLAMTQRRLSWGYRKWALEDEARGDRKAYLKHAAEARRLWREALWHLDYARNLTWH